MAIRLGQLKNLDDDTFCTIAEAAGLVNRHTMTIRRMIATDRLKAIRIAGTIYVKGSDLKELVHG